MSSGLTPNQAEQAIIAQIFEQADSQKLGIITGDAAVKVFQGAKLPPAVLGEIWNIADEDNNGFLTRKGVAIAVRLMGYAQKGTAINKALLDKPGPLPTIEGISAPVVSHSTGLSVTSQPGSSLSFPPLTPNERAHYIGIFANSGPTNGLLSSNKAGEIFTKSKLPMEKLAAIWSLADTQDRGALDQTDFVIGMHLISSIMSGKLSFIPTSLPPGFYETAAGKPIAPVVAHSTGSGASFSPTHTGGFATRTPLQPQTTGQALRPQYTGQTLQPQATGYKPTPPARPAAGIPAFPTSPVHWDVTPAEKASADTIFSTLDKQGVGYIEGDIAVPFLLQSNLPEEVLASVWDLADINNDGRLTRDGFAVAMHLIQGKLAGKDIPPTLPPSLVPPSMRGGQAAAAPAPVSAPAPPPPQPQHDLLWDDDPPSLTGSHPQPQPQALFQSPQHTGAQQYGTAAKPAQSVFAPSIPASDPFGNAFAPSAAPAKNLLDDDEEAEAAAAARVHEQSAEIGNTQNQLNSTQRSVETNKQERQTLEQTLANQAAQLSALQTQLASAKAAYETESSLLNTLRERHTKQLADIQKAREELIRAESDLSALRVEKAEIEGAFLRDKEEVRGLQRKMAEAGTEIETIKIQIEKAKKDAKQQKGLLAIAKKQLAAKEAEKEKHAKELTDTNGEVEEATKELQETETALAKEDDTAAAHSFAAPTPFTVSAEVAVSTPERVMSPGTESLIIAASTALPLSPENTGTPASISSGRSNNPFERLVAASSSTPRSQSPFLPFQNTGIPTPTGVDSAAAPAPTAPAVPEPAPTAIDDNVDPFGFSRAFDDEPASAPSVTVAEPEPIPAGASTPKATAASSTQPDGERPLSPSSNITSDNDFFSTPPTTANPLADHSPKMPGQFPGMESQLEHADNRQSVGPTDLSAGLKELDMPETDSDSDSEDEDDEPLAERRTSLLEKGFTEKANDSAPTINGSATPLASTANAGGSSAFDDAFGIASPPAAAASTKEDPTSIFNVSASPFPDVTEPNKSETANGFPAFPPAQATTQAPVAGADEFDEAFKSKPSQSNEPSQSFSFDNAFDDNFDFASAQASFPIEPIASSGGANVASPTEGFPPAASKNPFSSSPASAAFPPIPKAGASSPFAPATNGHAQPANEFSSGLQAPPARMESGPIPFNDPFGVPSVPLTAGAPQLPKIGDQGPSFDDIFGVNAPAASAPNVGAGGTPDGSKLTASSKMSSEAPSTARSERSNSVASSAQSPPPFPASTPASPSRTASPPPPKGRSSTASSGSPGGPASISDKTKEQSSGRHPKLSIRLPFGKKKKQGASRLPDSAPPPLPVRGATGGSSHLTPAVEEPTPPGTDDIAAVKQLCSMGFSRSQAVEALEKYDYDVQRALNNLLGTS